MHICIYHFLTDINKNQPSLILQIIVKFTYIHCNIHNGPRVKVATIHMSRNDNAFRRIVEKLLCRTTTYLFFTAVHAAISKKSVAQVPFRGKACHHSALLQLQRGADALGLHQRRNPR